ncbi:MAG: hypothetical protein M1140_14160 [Chloroflexi bacterium]|nr:hypothetical protein [Chloroflexota bacterium]
MRNTLRSILIPAAGGLVVVLLLGAQALASGGAARIIIPPVPARPTVMPVSAAATAAIPGEVTQDIEVPVGAAQTAQQVKVIIDCKDLLKNGDFEAPLPAHPWVGVANTARTYAVKDSFITNARAHGGRQSARIGSPTLSNYWSELIQTVQLPKRVTSVTLTYWRFLNTPAGAQTRVYDTFSAGLETAQGIQIAPPQQIDNTSAGRGAWVKSTLTLPNASNYSSQGLWVSFKGATRARTPSMLFVDDVQLLVCAAR